MTGTVGKIDNEEDEVKHLANKINNAEHNRKHTANKNIGKDRRHGG